MTNKEVIDVGVHEDIAYDEYDRCSNHCQGIVFNVDGDLYLIEKVNGRFSETEEALQVRSVEVVTCEYEPIEA
jgi:hypothetical protein